MADGTVQAHYDYLYRFQYIYGYKMNVDDDLSIRYHFMINLSMAVMILKYGIFPDSTAEEPRITASAISLRETLVAVFLAVAKIVPFKHGRMCTTFPEPTALD